MVAITAVQRISGGAMLLRRAGHAEPTPRRPARANQEEPWPAR